MFNFLSEVGDIAVCGSRFILDNLQASLTQVFAQLVVLLYKVVFGKVVNAEWVPWIGLESSLKKESGLFSRRKVIDIRCKLNDSQRGQSHRILRVKLQCFIHAELGLGQVAKPVVAETNAKPNVRGTPRVIEHHLLQLCKTLLDIALEKLDNGLSQS